MRRPLDGSTPSGAERAWRVVNHVPLEKWVRLARNRSALDRTADE